MGGLVRTREAELVRFYRERFRAEFKPAFDAWLATKPLKTEGAPLTPFAMPQYRLAARAEAERLDQAAEVLAAQVRRYIQRASNYVLGVVLFAVALFFAAMSTKLTALGLRKAILAVGLVIFVGTVVWIATFPVSVAIWTIVLHHPLVSELRRCHRLRSSSASTAPLNRGPWP